MPNTPDVSVIVAVYNGLPYLAETLDSVVAQTIGVARLQVIVVDDGSTDGTAEYLDRRAAAEPYLEVIHQSNSGGPAQPRNRALTVARGRYVFFLDGDDTLAPESLATAVGYADRNETDVVLLRMRGTGGRPTPRAQFTRTVAKADVLSTSAYWSLNPMKLFRTTLIRDHALEFPTDMPWGEDQPFVAKAMLAARAISVVSDRDYVMWRRRDDATNITYVAVSLADRMPVADRMFDLVAQHVPAGPGRDRLMGRHFAIELVDSALPGYRDCTDEGARDAAFARFRELVDAYLTPEIERGLAPQGRVAVRLISDGDAPTLQEHLARLKAAGEPEPLVEGDRVFLPIPGFREGDPRFPEELFDIGHRIKAKCRLERVRVGGGRLSLTAECRMGELTGRVTGAALVLSSKQWGEKAIPVAFTFRNEIVHGVPRPWIMIEDSVPAGRLLAGVPSGVCDLHLRLFAGDIERSCRLAECAPAPATVRHLVAFGARPAVGTLVTTAYGNLSLRVSRSARDISRAIARMVLRRIRRN